MRSGIIALACLTVVGLVSGCATPKGPVDPAASLAAKARVADTVFVGEAGGWKTILKPRKDGTLEFASSVGNAVGQKATKLTDPGLSMQTLPVDITGTAAGEIYMDFRTKHDSLFPLVSRDGGKTFTGRTNKGHSVTLEAAG